MPHTQNSAKKPAWLKVDVPSGDQFHKLKNNLAKRGLATVCQEASCPNIGECWQAQTATVMILGDTCTRACKFCHVKTGNPHQRVDPKEIDNTVEMVGMMNLKYIVITSVDRDDLPDFGAGHFAAVVKAVTTHYPATKVEVLVPDFNGEKTSMHTLASSRPFVIAQNIETVKRLTHPVRDPRAGYHKTLDVLSFYKANYPAIATKSSVMVGLGETIKELSECFEDLRRVGVSVLTIGQYLRPSMRHLKVEKYYHPDEFKQLKELALERGFEFVASGPLVRSSYKAGDYLEFLESQ